MFFLLIAATIFVLLLVILYQNVEVDLTLKFYELFGKKVDALRGQVVWITGASSGLGEHLAYELASAGCKLVLSARRQLELERVKAKCCELAGDKLENNDILVLPLDVCKFDTHEEAVKRVLSHFNQIDILVNNSGKSQRGMVVDTELKVDQQLFELNVMGSISLTKAVLPHMLERKAGHIVIVSSVVGKFGLARLATYSATKFAVQGYFASLRTEVYGNGIDVSIVCPGPIKSPIVDNAVTEKYGKSMKDMGRTEDMSQRMETDKFAKLMAIAVANKLDECWITPQSVLWMIYVSQYMPTIFNWIQCKKYSAREAEKPRQEKKED